MKSRLLLVILWWMAEVSVGKTQPPPTQVEKGFELHELVKIGETYKNMPNLSFSVAYSYADSTAPTTFLENLSGSMKIKDGKYWSLLDSIEFIQGQQYDIAVYYGDSTVVINNQREYGDMLKIPALDSAFQKANVDSMKIVEVNDSTRLLTLFFNKDASYSLYKLQYDKNKYILRKMEYYLRNMPDPAATKDKITGLITVVYSNYSEAVIDPSIFQEDRVVSKVVGGLAPKPAFSKFKIYNNTITNQPPPNGNNNN